MPEKVTEHCLNCQNARPSCICNTCKNDSCECCVGEPYICPFSECPNYEQEATI